MHWDKLQGHKLEWKETRQQQHDDDEDDHNEVRPLRFRDGTTHPVRFGADDARVRARRVGA
jgi:hypothetical protein